jgi:colicin/pyocin-S2-like DNase family protein
MEAPIPSQVAQRLRGRSIANFDEFRRAIWEAAAGVPELAGQFSAANVALMRRGMAPKAPPDLQVPGSTIFHLIHVKHPSKGGGVYDVDNIRVVSPLRHFQILHYGGLPFEREAWIIDRKAARPQLLKVLHTLMTDGNLKPADETRLIDEFERGVFYPHAADLLFHWGDEFSNLGALLDFALALEEPKRVSRDELVAATKRLMTADVENPVQSERLSMLFNANVPHPDGDGLIFHPKVDLRSAEEVVAHALAYRPTS